MDIKDFLNYFIKKIWIVIIAFVLCTALSGGLTYFNKILYLSTPKIIIGPQSTVSKDGKFVTNLVFVISDLIENDKVVSRLSNETGLSIDKETLKGIVSTDMNDQHQRIYFIIKSSNRDTVRLISDKLPDIIASSAKEIYNIDNLIVVKSDKIVVEGKNYKKNVISGAVAGIGLGFLIVFILLLYDDRLRNRKDVKRLFGIEYLGLINDSHSGKKYNEENINLLCTRLLLKSDIKPSKVLLNINFGLRENDECIYNIANCLAGLDKKILIIDLDKSSKVSAVKINNDIKYGLCDILSGDAFEYAQSVYKTDNNNMDIVPFGKCEDISLAMIMKRNLNDFIKSTTEKYDMLILNIASESGLEHILLLSHLCDGTMLTIKEGNARTNDVERVVNNLKDSGTVVLGYSTAL